MTDETNIPIRASKDFKIPELTDEARELCAGDLSRPDVVIPKGLLENKPSGYTNKRWAEMVVGGHQLYRAEGSPEKGEHTLRFMDKMQPSEKTR